MDIEDIDKILQLETLETEIKIFVCSLPYWGKYICSKILADSTLSDSDIDTAYSHMLEELGLVVKTDKPEITLNYNTNNSEDYKQNLFIDTLQKVEGVNALSENQKIEFSPNITIMYGANGSGKSGYVRLLKNVFYSKHKESILPNIYKIDPNKPINAEFNFISEENAIPLAYPVDSENAIFSQFAVFDGKIALKHLEDRNDFEFRPAGLTLFSAFNGALEKLQQTLNNEIILKSIDNPYPEIFEGESEINTLVSSLSSNSKLDDLRFHYKFTEQDRVNKQKIDKDYDNLKIALSQKENSLKVLRGIKTQLFVRKEQLEGINQYFKQDYLDSIYNSISDCKKKQEIAKKEGVEKFKTDKLKKVGSSEWKCFIEAAEKFALSQKEENQSYPEIGDNCLLCQQPIIDQEQSDLIRSYWKYIKSFAEQEAKTTQESLNKIKTALECLNLKQFSETDTLTVWLKENHENILYTLTQTLAMQETLKANVISDIVNKSNNEQVAIQVDLSQIDNIDTDIDRQIKMFEEDEQNKTLAELLKKKTYLAHKEKLEQQFNGIEKLHQNMVWVSKANEFNKQFWKRHSTTTEKRLSQKYFNEQYIINFNKECEYLNGNFGIDIDAKSLDAQSNRKLFLKGRTPSDILSEGEQKVIAIADFMAETKITTINRGIILDDPVNSLDEERKDIIAKRLSSEAQHRQVIVFTHDLVFLSNIINSCSDYSLPYKCHWIEKLDDEVGKIWLDNTPSYEKKYKTSAVAQDYYKKAKDAPPEERENFVKNGFAALRSSYEAFVIFDLFAGVVQRFNDRVSVDSLSSIHINSEIITEVMDSFYLACRYMEGHSHSDKFLSKKPTPEQLTEEIQRFDCLKKTLKDKKRELGIR